MLVESLWKILSFILVIILLFVFPIMHLYDKQDDLVYYRVRDDVNAFVNVIKFKGYLEATDWNAFTNRINSYGYGFDAQITHKKAHFVPVYENPQDDDSFEGNVKKVYYDYSHDDIMNVIFGVGTGAGVIDAGSGSAVENHVYKMSAGDFIVVNVRALHNTKADVMRNKALNADLKNSFNMRFSGMIAN